MNDFTKEELASMLNWGDVYSEFGHSWTYKITKPLMDKLQSMIENYCLYNPHIYEFSLGPGYCENCGISENDAYRQELEMKNE